jgi:hypothetical protein
LNDWNQIWRNNHGWMLSGASAIAALAACVILYFDMVPRIALKPLSEQPVVAQAIQAQNGILVAHVVAAKKDQGKRGRIQLYLPNQDQTKPPVYQESFSIDERGMAAILLVVNADEYLVVAYIDENDNGLLDFIGDQPVEIFRLPKPVAGSISSENSPTEGGIIQLQPQIPYLCVFDFSQP